ncbi:MAG TPA: cadherin domain-containing protein [Pseudomonadales bacterium]|nr:cadherin domain-containing protein [Pseudomonadales bacterium]
MTQFALTSLLALALAVGAGPAGAATPPGFTITNVARGQFAVAGTTVSISDSVSFVTDAGTNLAPTAIAIDATVVASGVAAAVVGTLTVTDPDAGDTHGFAASDARFEVVAGVLRLRAGIVVDGALEPTVSLTVTATDTGGLSFTQAFTLTVEGATAPPQAPTDIVLDNRVLSSGTPGAVVGTVTVVDADPDDVHGFAVDDARFEVIAGVLRLKAAFAVDGFAEPTVTVTVTATDRFGLDFAKAFALTVATSAPPVSAAGSRCSAADVRGPEDSSSPFVVCENVAGASVAQLTFGARPLTFDISDARFEVAAGLLRLRSAISLDREREGQVPVTVRVLEGGVQIEELALVVAVRDRNEAPSLAVADATVRERVPGAVIGPVTVTDPDAGDSFTITVDDPRFEVVAGTLKLRDGIALGAADGASLTLAITVTDAGGLAATATARLSIQAANLAPVAEPRTTGVAVGAAAGTTIDRVVASDANASDRLSYAIVSGNRGGAFAIDPADGSLRVLTTAALGADGDRFDLVIRVSDDNSSGDAVGVLSTQVPVLVQVTSRNTPPFVEDQRFAAVPENLAVGAVLGVVGALDVNEPLAFRIVSGDPAGRFRIDARSGAVTLAEPLDFEAQADYRLGVAVTDSAAVPLTAVATVSLSVTDVNDAPVLSPARFSIASTAPLGSPVGTVTFLDPDRGDVVTLSIVDGNEAGAFAIDANTGTLKVVNLGRLAADVRSVQLRVRALDSNAAGDPRGRRWAEAVVTIDLAVANAPPTAIRLSNLVVAAGTPGVVVGEVTVVDADAADTHVVTVDDSRFEVIAGVLRLRDGQAIAAGETVHLAITAIDPLGQSLTRVFPVNTGVLERNPAKIAILRAPSGLLVGALRGSVDLSPQASLGSTYTIGQTQCSTTASSDGPFVDVGDVRTLDKRPLPIPGTLELVEVDTLKVGEAVFVRVTDPDANIDPAAIDAIVIDLEVSGSQDREILRVLETGPDTGIFVGYIQSTSRASVPYDCALWLASDVTMRIHYFDALDGTDTVAAAALVDPFGIVFDAATGRRIDGAVVRLVDATTGQAAAVFGDDPFLPYPAVLESGGSAVDEGGIVYEFAAGAYRFPFVATGPYRLEVTPPNRFQFPSAAADAEIAALANGPFVVGVGSRGETFEVPIGPAVRIDLPLDVTPIEPTASSMRLFRLAAAADAGAAESVRVARTQCVVGGAATLLDLPADASGAVLDLPARLSLLPTTTFRTGDTLFVQVIDPDEDHDPFVADSVTVRFAVTAAGETETVTLTESGESTGVFTGYVGSTSNESGAGDCAVGVGPDAQLEARYADADDGADSAVAVALVDPSARVFDAATGSVVDGARITLIDVATGAPASPLGDDGVSAFPATVVSGGRARDDAGRVYDFPAGRFRFPVVPAGEYRYEVEAPVEYLFPAAAPDDQLQTLDGAPFRLDAGSRGGSFTVSSAAPSVRDLPVEPISAELFIAKTALKEVVAIGDFVQYEITVQNAGAGDAGLVTLDDVMPHGFRYQKGSARIDGQRLEGVSVGDDGRSLALTLPPLRLGDTLRVRYVAEVAAGARLGEAVNRVTGRGPAVRRSNTAEASVVVREDLLRSKAILVGRVVEGACDTPAAERKGLAGVRIYMEDGTSVISDTFGRWHIENVEPGTHVVQMDMTSLPASRRVLACEENTRFAGTPFSRFVDVQGGSLWRADFHVAMKPPVEEDVTTRLRARVNGERVLFALEAQGREVPLTGLTLVSMLPEGLVFEPGSARRNGEPMDDPAGAGGAALTFRLGDTRGAWSERITFSARITEGLASGTAEVRTLAMFGTPTERRVRSELASTELRIRAGGDAAAQGIVVDLDGAGARERLQRLIDQARAERIEIELLTTGTVAPWVAELAAQDGVTQRPADASEGGDGEPAGAVPTPPGAGGSLRLVRRGSVDGTPAVALVRADSGVVRTRAVGEVPGLAPEVAYAARALPEQQAPAYDASTVGSAEDGPAILYPQRGFLPRITSTGFVVRAGIDDTVELTLDGEPVSPLNFDGRTRYPEQGVALFAWRGIEIGHGRNTLMASVTSPEGVVRTLARDVYFSAASAHGEYVREASRLVADGTTVPEIAIRFFDASGSPVRPGMTGEFRVLAPYQAYDPRREEVDIALVQDADRSSYLVIEDGIAYLPLEPTTRAGEVRIEVRLEDNRTEEFRARLEPVAREWILVGFGEGTAGYETLSRNMVTAEDAGHDAGVSVDGRVALFARGMIQGKWLLTMAYDTDKEDQRRIGQQVDPDRFYSLYGDGAQQQYDAESAEKLYLKIERSGFSALFGDFDTVLGGGELTRYSRRLTGVRSEYGSEDWDLVVFGAETENAYVRDEIRGDGTSGLYRLSGRRIIENSERIVVETRDRFHDEDILETRALGRHVDYSIDYDTGELLFKSPVMAQDADLNPVFIVAQYETAGRGDGRRDLIAGGRAARRLLDGDAEVGATVVHDGTRGAESVLSGIDAEWQLDQRTELRAEAAFTNGKAGLDDDERSGAAWLVEAERRGEKVTSRGYYKEQQADFGIGQQNVGQGGTRRFGVTAEARVSTDVQVDSEAYQQSQLESGATRNVVETKASWNATGSTRLGVGGRAVRETSADGDDTATNQLTADAQQRLFDGRVRLNGRYERALGGTDSRDFPTRAGIGAEVDVLSRLTLIGTQEFTWADERDTQDTHVGATARPWSGADIDAGVTERLSENGQRLFANVGIKQALQLTEHWKFDFGLDREQTLENSAATPGGALFLDDRDSDRGDGAALVQDADGQFPARPPASGAAADSDFTSGFVGAAYEAEHWQVTGRGEYRHADLADKLNLRLGFARQLDEGRIFSLTVDYLTSDGVREDATTGAARLGLAWRPQTGSWTFLDRLDLVFDERMGPSLDFTERKLVNNFNANFKPNKRNQLALQLGMKYVLDDIDGESYSSFTTLAGAEYRYDLSKRWDFGLHGNVLNSWSAGVADYRSGVSLGHTPMRNVWVSVGYNFTGFHDEDFEGADYMAQGPFVKFRFKVDQASLKDYLGELPFSLD